MAQGKPEDGSTIKAYWIRGQKRSERDEQESSKVVELQRRNNHLDKSAAPVSIKVMGLTGGRPQRITNLEKGVEKAWPEKTPATANPARKSILQ